MCYLVLYKTLITLILNHCFIDSQRLFLRIFVHLKVSMQPFIWVHVVGPTSYLSKNFKLPKFWTSEVQHPSCPILNFLTIQTVDIFFSLIREPACPPYLLNLLFDIFQPFLLLIMIEYRVLANMLTLPI